MNIHFEAIETIQLAQVQGGATGAPIADTPTNRLRQAFVFGGPKADPEMVNLINEMRRIGAPGW